MKNRKIAYVMWSVWFAASACLSGCTAREDIPAAGGSDLPPAVVSEDSTASAGSSAAPTLSGASSETASGEAVNSPSGIGTRKTGLLSTTDVSGQESWPINTTASPSNSTVRPSDPTTRPTVRPTTPTHQEPVDLSPGNTPGNIASGGGFVVKNNHIYYSNYKDNHKLYSMRLDGSDSKKMSDDSAVDISTVGDRVYYVSFPEKGLYSVKSDGTDKRTLYTGQAGMLNVTGGRIYYCDVDDGYHLYSMKLDGSDRKKLTDDWIHELLVEGDRIYYTIYNESRHIYTMKIDGTGRTKLSDDDATDLQLANGRLYYFVVEGGAHGIYSMKTDGTDRRCLLFRRLYAMHVHSDLIYFIDHQGTCYVMKTDGNGLSKLGDLGFTSLYMAGERLFYAGPLGWIPVSKE